MAFGIQIIGLDKLVAGFNAAPATARQETISALTKGGLLIESSARSLAPKKTGRLAGSITSRVSGLTAEIGPSVRYGLFVETGTRPHWMPPGILPFGAMRTIAQRGTRAQPYMKPAFDQNVGRVTRLFEDIGFKVVQRIAS